MPGCSERWGVWGTLSGPPMFLQQAVAGRVGDSFEPAVDVELAEEVLDVVADRGRAHVQAVRGRFGVEADGE